MARMIIRYTKIKELPKDVYQEKVYADGSSGKSLVAECTTARDASLIVRALNKLRKS